MVLSLKLFIFTICLLPFICWGFLAGGFSLGILTRGTWSTAHSFRLSFWVRYRWLVGFVTLIVVTAIFVVTVTDIL